MLKKAVNESLVSDITPGRMLKKKSSKLSECLCGRPRLIIFFLPCIILLALYIVSDWELEVDSVLSIRSYDLDKDDYKYDKLPPDGYLVWNSKCHMVSKDPMDSSIKKLVKKQKFESCGKTPLLTYISKNPENGTISIVINAEVAKYLKNPICCWAPVSRPPPTHPPKGSWDTNISSPKCKNFTGRLVVPQNVETVLIKCNKGKNNVYENVHAIINPAKIQNRLKFQKIDSNNPQNTSRKLSVLLLGIDSVSRLNFLRSMPKTEKYLRATDWINLRGYNKMGDNTFPNLMAILTGQNSDDSYSKCKPTKAYGLDNCSILWYNYRNAGYVTAHGEDVVSLSTFNYRKVGFVDPPTDYYMRPYVLATERFLQSKKRFNFKYCTGPEISVERIFNFASEFARTFIQTPYFGFFWTNSVSHDDMNGLSSMDDRFYEMFEGMERDGIFNDTMIIFLSDHGMRWGSIRNTFVGWYEERLPFIYIRLPEWFRTENPQAYKALQINEHRLTSPYDLYETLRDVLIRAGGEANSSIGCPRCQSLLRPVPEERGCDDVGVSPHWCTCRAFETGSTSDEIAVEGTREFLEHAENIVKDYKDKNGTRLCSKLELKKIHRVDKVIDIQDGNSTSNDSVVGYFYLIEVSPGGGRFETTVRYHGDGNFTISEDDVSRVNSYAKDAHCLEHGSKQYCHCIEK